MVWFILIKYVTNMLEQFKIINKKIITLVIIAAIILIAVFLLVLKPLQHSLYFPKNIPNSNFSIFANNVSMAINSSNTIKIGNFTVPPYHGFRTFYVNGNYTIALFQQTFFNSSVAMNYFTEMKRALLLNISANTSITKNMILISNLQPNMFGTNTSIKNLSNSYSITAVNGTRICSAGLFQYTKNSISNPVSILKTAIAVCFKA